VQLCCGRQKRILSDALACLKEGGMLIYSTCSYSPEEDEDLADWLMQDLGMQNLNLVVPDSWSIVTTSSAKKGAFGYRFFPDKLQGEGFYLACFRKNSGSSARYKMAKPEKATAREKTIIAPWLADNDLEIWKEGSYLYALPCQVSEAYSVVKGNLYVQQAGLRLGEIMKDKLVPDHALALSTALAPSVAASNLELDEAIRYLQRQDISLQTERKGWQTVRYHGHNLGWINALSNRLNNYYPKEFRILKQWDSGPMGA
jgi:NOL1/NOP2/fmu family ribosome biogenesis protein